MSYYGKGHILKRHIGPKELFDYLWGLTQGLKFSNPSERKKYHRFIVHVYANMKFNFNKARKYDYAELKSVPIYSRRLEKEFGREFNASRLEGIMEITPHNHGRHKSREYRIKWKVFEKAVGIEREFVFHNWKSLSNGREKVIHVDPVNLVTGTKRGDTALKTELKCDDDRNISKLIKKSVRILEPCPINPVQGEKYLKKFFLKYKNEKRRFKKIEANYGSQHEIYQQAEKDFKKAFGRYLNVQTALETILYQQPTRMKIRSTKGDPLYKYQGAYTIQISGRITEIRGGYQSAPRFLKHVLTKNIENLHNYDLVNSQANLLLEEFKRCGIKCEWLKKYIETPGMKQQYAKKIKIPVDVWKSCFYALLMGAEAESAFGDIHKVLNAEIKNKEKLSKVHEKFLKITRELREATEVWRDYIYKAEDRRHIYLHDKKTHWKNACNMHYKKYFKKLGNLKSRTERTNEKECKRKIAAFMLQGLEASFIHNLVALCKENKIPVYKNEHDGLIAGKEIGKELTEEAAKLSGIRTRLKLEIKQICSKQKIKEVQEYLTTPPPKKNIEPN